MVDIKSNAVTLEMTERDLVVHIANILNRIQGDAIDYIDGPSLEETAQEIISLVLKNSKRVL